MSTHDFSIEYLANSLIVRLDRRNIFPPLHDNPELFLSSVGSVSNLSSYRPKRPPNAFLICRKNVQEESKRRGSYNMRIISKVTSILWKNASREEREVYKRLVNSVYEIHYKRTCTMYKKIAESSNSSKRRSSNKLSLKSSTTTSVETPLPSLTLPPPTNSIFNFDLIGNDFLLNNQSNNDNVVDFNSYTNFNGQFHNSNQHELTFNNNSNNNNNTLATPQNFCF
ncbi:hypothetical protein RclHR1_27450001 [Rhizophagus clarus]|uniref:HMG box domain-containing protein n=1 Tax=Rhizophagus clarus TaxID=94130 RepID=A0A2Z6RHM2_9GLOM|nr:hypothetical protein RclHR1_27450001 [Rhizophagus clarus]GET00004.1 hypothetical protein GLOIN_2v1836889 [Rhizophagus clarus]